MINSSRNYQAYSAQESFICYSLYRIILAYTDDLLIGIPGSSPLQVQIQLQYVVEKVGEWCNIV